MLDFVSDPANSWEKLGYLILEELKLIRNDMKAELQHIAQEIMKHKVIITSPELQNQFVSINKNQSPCKISDNRNKNVSLAPYTAHEDTVTIKQEVLDDDVQFTDLKHDKIVTVLMDKNCNQPSENLESLDTCNGNALMCDVEGTKFLNTDHTYKAGINLENLCKDKTNAILVDDLLDDQQQLTIIVSQTNDQDISFSNNYSANCIDDNIEESDLFAENKDQSEKKHFEENLTHFQCKVCLKKLSSFSSYQFHLSLHNNKNLLSHILVGSPLNERKRIFSKHKKLHSMKKTQVCSFCHRKFQLKSDLLKHLKLHCNGKLFVCKICNKTFESKKIFDRHEKLHKYVKSYVCEYCDRKYLRKSDLTKHTRLHTGEKPFACDICGKIYELKTSLLRHLKFHELSDNQHTCKHCSEKFSKRSDLLRHSKIHIGQKPFGCRFCHRCFKFQKSLEKHESMHENSKLHACDSCDERFLKRSCLIKHKKVHISTNVFPCTFCGKIFHLKSSLIRHEKLHKNIRPYSCEYCDKSFIGKSDMIKHTRTHTGEKPYACSFCSKRFGRKGSLLRHEKGHNNIRPHACAYCDRKFQEKSDMIKHIRLHLGEKSYTCNVCNKLFAFKKKLKEHEKTHTEV